MVGRSSLVWDGPFSRAMLVLGSVFLHTVLVYLGAMELLESLKFGKFFNINLSSASASVLPKQSGHGLFLTKCRFPGSKSSQKKPNTLK